MTLLRDKIFINTPLITKDKQGFAIFPKIVPELPHVK